MGSRTPLFHVPLFSVQKVGNDRIGACFTSIVESSEFWATPWLLVRLCNGNIPFYMGVYRCAKCALYYRQTKQGAGRGVMTVGGWLGCFGHHFVLVMVWSGTWEHPVHIIPADTIFFKKYCMRLFWPSLKMCKDNTTRIITFSLFLLELLSNKFREIVLQIPG